MKWSLGFSMVAPACNLFGMGCSAAAAEISMRQRGIVAIHAVTTTNAIHHAFRTTADDATRQFLLLQNAAFLPMFRQAAKDRGDLADRRIDELRIGGRKGRRQRASDLRDAR